MLYYRGGFALKKVISVVLVLALVSFTTAGCGRKGSSTLGLSTKKSSQLEQVDPNNNTNLQSNKNSSAGGDKSMSNTNTNAAASTNTKLQETSNLMDKLDSTLNGLDNSSDITTTESIINNIN
jgi:predicted small lipoprotein YifL